MELYVFARFRACEGREDEVAAAIREVVRPSSAEPGCVRIAGYRSTRDPRLHYIHSTWRDEAAFDSHAAMPHTRRFIDRVEQAIDHPLDIARTVPL
jgi:quinol monooxygenase YgiN